MKKQNYVIWIQSISLFSLYAKKADYIYNNNAEDVGTRFDASNYKLDRPMPKGKIK